MIKIELGNITLMLNNQTSASVPDRVLPSVPVKTPAENNVKKGGKKENVLRPATLQNVYCIWVNLETHVKITHDLLESISSHF